MESFVIIIMKTESLKHSGFHSGKTLVSVMIHHIFIQYLILFHKYQVLQNRLIPASYFPSLTCAQNNESTTCIKICLYSLSVPRKNDLGVFWRYLTMCRKDLRLTVLYAERNSCLTIRVTFLYI